MKTCLTVAATAFLMSSSAVAQGAAENGPEAAFAQCIVDKDLDLAVQIRDAESREQFVEAFKKGGALCGIETADGMSLGRFFTALRAALQSAEDKK